MRNLKFGVLLSLSVLLFSCGAEEPELFSELPLGVQAVSLMGDTLFTLEISDEARNRFDNNLAQSQQELVENSDDPDALVWSGRWTAYKGEYREAIRIYTDGINKFPGDARMYRHRGHRYISIRDYSRAVSDFEEAVKLIKGKEDETEPDGLPNSRNIPVSSLHTNIWYHLGLAYYLLDDMEQALNAYRECLDASKNPDMVVASSYWLYMIMRRLGNDDEALKILEPINADMDIIENSAYHNLLLFYKGTITEESLTGNSFENISNAATGYGLGNWYYFNGDSERAAEIYRQILRGGQWAPFGYIAAEADLSRMR